MKPALLKELLSIIVPVYNVEEYLPRCIDSILSQTFTNFELILVDDGSTDSSGDICDEYADKDERIIVVHLQNGGASQARNKGIDIARGEYLMFIDSDDALGTNGVIEKNIKFLIESPKRIFVQIPVLWSYENGEEYLLSAKNAHYNDNNSIFRAFFNGNITSLVCDKIFKKEVFSNVRFPNYLRHYEDSYCVIDLLDNTDDAIISNRGFYKYYIRGGSSMQSDLTRQKVEDFFCMTVKSITKALSIKGTELYRVHTFLEMEDKLAYGRSFLEKDSLKYCNQLSQFIPEYKAIFSYIFKRNIKKGIKVLIIKFVGLKSFLRFK